LIHPNIVKIYEFYDIKDNYYLITEFCKYGELYNFIKFHFSEKQICVLFYQVFSGLIYLHENSIIHRDIKLENILIDAIEKDHITTEPYFYIKIIDFGTAKFFSKQKNEDQIIGSCYYIAPEVLKQKYNEKCDTWSAGVLLYMCLTKKAPFNGKNNDIILEKIKEGNYDKTCRKLMEYSSEVRDLLSNLLEVNDKKRFSARQALNHPWFKNFGGRDLFKNFSIDEVNTIVDNLLHFKNINKIQELVIAFLVHNSPSTPETLTILKIFRHFNTSGNCKLLKEELIEGLYKYKKRKEVDSMIEELFSIVDINKNGYIEYEEFLTAGIDKSKLLTKENLKYAFQFIDKENSHGIDGKKIINAFHARVNKVLEAVFNNIIIKVDEDGDGIINFEEFQRLCLTNITF
jgi:calcium-dependent protein kinase